MESVSSSFLSNSDLSSSQGITFDNSSGKFTIETVNIDNPLTLIFNEVKTCSSLYKAIHALVNSNVTLMKSEHVLILRQIVNRYDSLKIHYIRFINSTKIIVEDIRDRYRVSPHAKVFSEIINLGEIETILSMSVSVIKLISAFIIELNKDPGYKNNITSNITSKVLYTLGFSALAVGGICFLPAVAMTSLGAGFLVSGVASASAGIIVEQVTGNEILELEDIIQHLSLVKEDTTWVDTKATALKTIMTMEIDIRVFELRCNKILEICKESLNHDFVSKDIFCKYIT